MALRCQITSVRTGYRTGRSAHTCELRIFFLTNNTSRHRSTFISTVNLPSLEDLPKRSSHLTAFHSPSFFSSSLETHHCLRPSYQSKGLTLSIHPEGKRYAHNRTEPGLSVVTEYDTNSSHRVSDLTLKGNNELVTCYIRQGTGRTSNYTARNRQSVQIVCEHKRRRSYILQIPTPTRCIAPPEYTLWVNDIEEGLSDNGCPQRKSVISSTITTLYRPAVPGSIRTTST